MTLLAAQAILCVLFFALSAALSLAETSFMSLSRVQLSRLGKVHPGRLTFWEEDPDRALAAILFLNNLANSALGVLAVSMALGVAHRAGVPADWGTIAFPFVAAVLVILFAEILPKVVARVYPEPLAVALAPALRAATVLSGPLLQRLVEATGALLSRLSSTIRTERAQWDAAVIRALLDGAPAAHPVRHLLNNVMAFGAVSVRAVMVPRAEIVAADLREGRDALFRRVVASGYSRVPVHRGSLDKVEGMVYAKDLLAQSRSASLIALEDLVRPLLRVTVDTSLSQLLRIFRQGHHHIALVTDGFDRVEGLITLQDILESIVGDIAPERRTP